MRKLMARRMYLVQMCSRNFPRILNTVTSALTSVVMTFRSIVMIKPKTPNTKSMMVESRPPPPLGPPPKSGGQSNELGSQFSGILLVLAGLLLRERAQCPELLYARVDAAFHGGRVLFAGVEFLRERAVVADEERVFLVPHDV